MVQLRVLRAAQGEWARPCNWVGVEREGLCRLESCVSLLQLCSGSSSTPWSRCSLPRLWENPRPRVPPQLDGGCFWKSIELLSSCPTCPHDLRRLAGRSSRGSPCLRLAHRLSQCPCTGGDPPGPVLAQVPGSAALGSSWHKYSLVSPRVPALPTTMPIDVMFGFPFLPPTGFLLAGFLKKRFPPLLSPSPLFLEIPQVLKGLFFRTHFPALEAPVGRGQASGLTGNLGCPRHSADTPCPLCLPPVRSWGGTEVKVIFPPRTLCRRGEPPPPAPLRKPSPQGVGFCSKVRAVPWTQAWDQLGQEPGQRLAASDGSVGWGHQGRAPGSFHQGHDAE